MVLPLPCLRSDAEFSGRPSYGNVYAAVNAMAGHLNSFGPTAPVPKKRLERMLKVGKGWAAACVASRRCVIQLPACAQQAPGAHAQGGLTGGVTSSDVLVLRRCCGKSACA